MRILLFVFIFITTGCATTYQKTGLTGGFSETQLGENIWRVTFEGNGYTREERANDLALLRCADLTITKGYLYFGLIDSKASSDTSAYTSPSTSYTTGTYNSFGNSVSGYSHTTSYGGHMMLINKPSSSNVIVMAKQKAELQGFSFDANFICNSLGEKYQAKCGIEK